MQPASVVLFCFAFLLCIIVTIKLLHTAGLFPEVTPSVLHMVLVWVPWLRSGGSIWIGDSFIADMSPWTSLFKNQAQHIIAGRSRAPPFLKAEDVETFCRTGSGLILLFFPPRPNYYLGQHSA